MFSRFFMRTVVLSVALTSLPAYAVFQDITAPPKPKIEVAAKVPYFIEQVGYGVSAPVASSGRNVPVAQAMFLVLPDGWRVGYGSGNVAGTEVTWSSKKTWVASLEEMARSGHLGMRVDWDNRVVGVSRYGGPTGSSAPRSPKLAARDSSAVTGGSTDSAPAQVQADKPENLTIREFYEQSVFVSPKGLTLREAIAAISPKGWEIRMSDTVESAYKSDRFDLLTQGPRGAALARLLAPRGLKAVPYTKHHVIVIKGLNK